MGYDKKKIFKILTIILVIIAMIISVNIRLDKEKKMKEEYIGYMPDDPNAEEIIGDEIDEKSIALYDYYLLVQYFAEYEDAIEFKDFLNNYIIETGTSIKEWWIKDINFNNEKKELTFYIKTNVSKEEFYVRKNNNDTIINRRVDMDK